MPTPTKIFIIGSTGFIGGNILNRLLILKPSFNITALVRSAEKTEKLKTLGIHAVQGSHDDFDLVESLAAEADLVISVADSDNLGAAQAVLSGLKIRHEKSGIVPSLIHFSGTGVLRDNARGMYSGEKYYSDVVLEDIESLPITQIHRNIDLEITNADSQQGFVKTYIILPSYVYGVVDNTLTRLGIQRVQNVHTTMFVKIALGRGAPGFVGEGKNLNGMVHNDELTDLVILIFNSILAKDDKAGHGREGYYFAVNHHTTWYDFQYAIGTALFEEGRIKSPVPTSFTPEEEELFGPGLVDALGANTCARSDRGRALGWNPTMTKEEYLESQKEAVRNVLASL